MQGPFLLCLCQRGAFTGFWRFFFFAVPLSRKRKAVCDRPIHEWNKPSHTAGKPEEWFCMSDRTRSARHTKSYFPDGGLPGFMLPAVSISLLGISFLRISLLKFSCLICLHFRLPPFSRLSGAHQVVISVLGAKVIPGLDGNARSSLLFSVKISSPAGSIFPENSAKIFRIA